MSASAQQSQDDIDFQEKLQRRRQVVDRQGASFESTPSKRVADEGPARAESERWKMANGKWVCQNGLGLAGGDFRYTPASFWDMIYAEFSPPTANASGAAYHTPAKASSLVAPDTEDSEQDVLKLGSLRLDETESNSTTEGSSTPSSISPGKIVLARSDDDEPASQHPAEQTATLETAADSDSDVCVHRESMPSAAKRLLAGFPRPFLELKSRMGTWRQFYQQRAAAAATNKGRVQHSLCFVKSKARKLATKTRKGLVEVPSQVSRKTQKGAANARALKNQLSQKAEKATASTRSSFQTHLGLGFMNKETERSSLVSGQMSEKAQRGLEKLKEQAQIASSAISTQVSQTAQKGRAALARNLGRVGGA